MINDKTGLVSVVIPTWNRAHILGKTIDSVLNQTHTELELLICDDGSTDDSEELVISFADARLRWLPGERAGRPAPPRNRGVKNSKGDWLAFLDSDDQWTPNKLEKQLQAAARLKTQAVCSNAWRIVNNKNTHEKFIFWNRNKIRFKDILAGNVVINSSVIIQRSLFPTIIGFPEEEELTAIEDYALWLRAASITDFAFIDECLVEYNDEPAKSIRTKNLSINVNRRKVLDNFIQWAKESGADGKYIEMADKWLINSLGNIGALTLNAAKKIKRNFFGK